MSASARQATAASAKARRRENFAVMMNSRDHTLSLKSYSTGGKSMLNWMEATGKAESSMAQQRLDKIIASTGRYSRREV